MSLISKKVIQNLNNRILTQSIIMQNLVDIILENGLISEEDLEQRIKKDVDEPTKTLDSLQKNSSDDTNYSEELEGFYFGPVGEA